MVYLTYPNKAEDRYGHSYADTVFTDGIPDILYEAKIGADYILKLYKASKEDGLIANVFKYQQTGNVNCIMLAIYDFCITRNWTIPKALLELSKHFEQGAVKYGERNWEKGLPEYCYIDSAIRHYLKWMDGQDDEPHDRAVIWNLICLWWTHENITTADKGDET